MSLQEPPPSLYLWPAHSWPSQALSWLHGLVPAQFPLPDLRAPGLQVQAKPSRGWSRPARPWQQHCGQQRRALAPRSVRGKAAGTAPLKDAERAGEGCGRSLRLGRSLLVQPAGSPGASQRLGRLGRPLAPEPPQTCEMVAPINLQSNDIVLGSRQGWRHLHPGGLGAGHWSISSGSSLCNSPPGTSTKHILDDISTMFDALADQLDAMLD